MIDLSTSIRAIQEKYGLLDSRRSEAATREAAALWGAEVGVHCRPTGGFLTTETVRLAWVDKYANALAILAHAPNGRWAIALEYQCHYRGYHSPVQVWNPLAFTSREEAIQYAAQALYAALASMREEMGATEASRVVARRLCDQLETHRCRQLALW